MTSNIFHLQLKWHITKHKSLPFQLILIICRITMQQERVPVYVLHLPRQMLEGQCSLQLPSAYSWPIIRILFGASAWGGRFFFLAIFYMIIKETKIDYWETCLHFLLILACDNYFSLPPQFPLSQKRPITALVSLSYDHQFDRIWWRLINKSKFSFEFNGLDVLNPNGQGVCEYWMTCITT